MTRKEAKNGSSPPVTSESEIDRKKAFFDALRRVDRETLPGMPADVLVDREKS